LAFKILFRMKIIESDLSNIRINNMLSKNDSNLPEKFTRITKLISAPRMI